MNPFKIRAPLDKEIATMSTNQSCCMEDNDNAHGGSCCMDDDIIQQPPSESEAKLLDFFISYSSAPKWTLEHKPVPEWLWHDESFVRDVVCKCPRILRRASKRLRDCPNIVKNAAKYDLENLNDTSARLRNDRETMSEIVQHFNNRNVLQYVGENLRNDKDFAIAAVRRASCNLRSVPLKMRRNHETMAHLCFCALRKHNNPAQYIPRALKRDHKFWRSVAQMMKDVIISPERCQYDPGLRVFFNIISHQDSLIENNEFISDMIGLFPMCFHFLPVHMRKNKELVIRGIRGSERTLSTIKGGDLCDDRDVISIAISTYGPNAMRYASHNLKSSVSFIADMIDENTFTKTEHEQSEFMGAIVRHCVVHWSKVQQEIESRWSSQIKG